MKAFAAWFFHPVSFVGLGFLIVQGLPGAWADLSADQEEYRNYSKVFPSHVEYCAGTALQAIDGDSGGAGGHAFVYIAGLCKDFSKPYPQVKPCDGTEEHDGVGISVDNDFQNVNWVAVPTHDLFIHGLTFKPNTGQGLLIDSSQMKELTEKGVEFKIFEGVRIKEKLLQGISKESTTDLLSFMTQNAIGTDMGMRYARNLKCVRSPFDPSRLPAIADDLNKLNNSYYLTGKTYHWSMFTDNCTHTSTRILEKAGIRKAIPAGQWLSPAIPKNSIYV